MISYKSTLSFKKNPIDMTTFVDLTFLLLIFFVIMSDLNPRYSIQIRSPQIVREGKSVSAPYVISVDCDGAIYFGPEKKLVDLVELEKEISFYVGSHKKIFPDIQPTLFLDIDRTVSYELFLQIINSVEKTAPLIRLIYSQHASHSNAPHVNS